LYIFNFAAQQIVAGNAYWTPPSSPGAPDAAFLNSTLGIAAAVIGFMFREFVVRLVQFAFKLLRVFHPLDDVEGYSCFAGKRHQAVAECVGSRSFGFHFIYDSGRYAQQVAGANR
jgi:hypothetical protein